MLLLRLHPEVAFRSCADCRRYEYGDDGKVKKITDVTPEGDEEKPKERPPGAKVPCETSVGCPKGHWQNPKGFTPEAAAAYDFFCECRAVGDFPNDPVVRQLAAAIDNAERVADRIEAKENAAIGFLRSKTP